MTAAPNGEALVFRWRRRRAVESFVLQAVPALLVPLAGGVILGSGPVDYRFYGWLAESAATIAAVLTVPWFLLHLALGRRVSVVLTPDGIQTGLPRPGLIRWSEVVSLRTVWRLAGRHVLLTRRSGPAVRLYTPRGSGWLPDRRFRRELAELRVWADRYGARIEQGSQDRRRTAAAVAVVILAVLATGGVRAADRGVIWPSAPTASLVPVACPALQAAGLDRLWPADTRTLDRDEQDRHQLGEYSYCGWVRRGPDAPYIRLSAVVRRHDGFAMSSPIAMAVRSYTSERAAESSPEPVSALGDEGFVSSAADEVLVVARRANVTVSIDLVMEPRDPEEAEAASRELTAEILAGIRLGDGPRR
ncbi:hypothetical protein DMB66_41610 [Actinoplanes sp. ATCC 53533]|uniref:hypothetical protein n=1 Tax=Actinoplanes sp. ATCC 53533 TaxID=1288362 RepID=UPI000F7A49BC|nr:hypothetical protein [Actinoplanes sp. ATCC 53533]RSM51571.1 hypothetical protein DMB66_41610 [Actinoplanes sp. ATCC 53533]